MVKLSMLRVVSPSRHYGRVGSCPASQSRGPRFKSWQRDWLLHGFYQFFGTHTDSTSNYAMIGYLHILFNVRFSIFHQILYPISAYVLLNKLQRRPSYLQTAGKDSL